jgi:hypothetical protein
MEIIVGLKPVRARVSMERRGAGYDPFSLQGMFHVKHPLHLSDYRVTRLTTIRCGEPLTLEMLLDSRGGAYS